MSTFKTLAELARKSFRAPQDEALAIAQKRAALPVSEGGLGLGAGNTAMERAAAMGYLKAGDLNDAPGVSEYWLHGTPEGGISKFLENAPVRNRASNNSVGPVWATNSPSEANFYAKGGHSLGGTYKDATERGLSPTVYPLMIRGNYKHNPSDAKPVGALNTANFTSHGSDQEWAVAGSPELVRSRFAAFDPFRRGESDLLAGIAPYAAPAAAGLAGLGVLAAPGESEAGIGSKLYHATTKDAGRAIKRWNEVEPRTGPMVESTDAYQSTDNPLDVSFFSDNLKDAAGWLRFFTSQKTGKPIADVTAADIAEHGALAVARKGPQHYRNLGEKIEDSSGSITSFARSPLYIHPDAGDAGRTSLPGYVERGDVFSLEPTRARVIEGPGLAAALQRRGVIPVGAAAALGAGTLAATGESEAGIGGVLAKTADLPMLDLAKQAAAKGLPAGKVLDATGWHMGPDGKWRFEFDDSGAKLAHNPNMLERLNKQGRPFVLDDLSNTLSHNALYGAYPDAAGVQVQHNLGGIPSGGAYNPASDRITLEGSALGHATGEAKSTLLHETQHAIQEREGFARGGVPSQFYSSTGTISGNTLAPEAQKIFDSALSDNSVGMSEAEKLFRLSAATKEAYRRLAGEVEARNVQTRMNMTPDERRMRPFPGTEDVPRADQIVQGQSPYAALSALETARRKRMAMDQSRTHAPPRTPGSAELMGRQFLESLFNPTTYLPLSLTPRELGRPEDLRLVNGEWR